MAKEFAHTKTVQLGQQSASGGVDPGEAKRALVEAIHSIPDEKLRTATSLFSSLRGGHVSVIV
ncbi:MAG TPA: hypothetical protein VIW69_15515 [Candidatus Elarobacter sp.]